MSKAIIATVLIFAILFIGEIFMSMGYIDVFNPLIVFTIGLFAIGIIVFIIIRLVRGFLLRHQIDENAIYVHRTLLYSGILGVIIAIPFFVKSFSSPGAIDDIIVFAALPPLLVFEFLLFFFVMRKWLKISFYVLSPLNILLLFSWFALSGIASSAGEGGAYIFLPWIFFAGGVLVIAGVTILIDIIKLIVAQNRKKELSISDVRGLQRPSFFYLKRNRIALTILGTIVVFQLILTTTPLITLASSQYEIRKKADPAIMDAIVQVCREQQAGVFSEKDFNYYSSPEPHVLTKANGESFTIQTFVHSPIDLFFRYAGSYCQRVEDDSTLLHEQASLALLGIAIKEEDQESIWNFNENGGWQGDIELKVVGKNGLILVKPKGSLSREWNFDKIFEPPHFVGTVFIDYGEIMQEEPTSIYLIRKGRISGETFEIPFPIGEMKKFHKQEIDKVWTIN